jgi:hypothetical protein
MYEVQSAEYRAGKEAVLVTNKGRRVSSASLSFVRWMHDFVPRHQLGAEQIAMVDWYGNRAA